MSRITTQAFAAPVAALHLERELWRLNGALKDSAKTAALWQAVDALRQPEGNAVEILCDNPEGQQAIVCCGDFTGYLALYFRGDSVRACLELARFVQDRFNEGSFRFERTMNQDHHN